MLRPTACEDWAAVAVDYGMEQPSSAYDPRQFYVYTRPIGSSYSTLVLAFQIVHAVMNSNIYRLLLFIVICN